MNELQLRVKEFCRKNNLVSPPEHHLLDLFSEFGEVSKELLKMTDYGRKPFKFRDEVKGELGDALYSLLALANSLDVDLFNELNKVLSKYEARLKKGGAGSEND